MRLVEIQNIIVVGLVIFVIVLAISTAATTTETNTVRYVDVMSLSNRIECIKCCDRVIVAMQEIKKEIELDKINKEIKNEKN